MRQLSCIVLLLSSLFTSQMLLAQANTIYVYSDDGVGLNSLQDTLDFFTKNTKYKVNTIKAINIISGVWQEDAVLLVIPGGADIPYANKLNGIGNKKISEYVTQGGTLLGICAGAYYASATVDFGRDTEMAVFSQRELKFFPGTSIGPIYSTTTFTDRRDAKCVSITWKDQKLGQLLNFNQQVPVYYFGGGYFSNALKYPQTKILASYDCCQEYPAIVSNKVGLGQVILSAVHFEYQPKYDPAVDGNFKDDIAAVNRELQNNKDNRALQKQMLIELFADKPA